MENKMPTSSIAPRPTPSIPSGGIFSPFAEAVINAPAEVVYNTILDTSKYPEYNTFVPSVTIDHQPEGAKDATRLTVGTAFTMKVKMTATTTTLSKEIVTIVDPPPQPNSTTQTPITRICWSLDNKAAFVPRSLLYAERVHEIEHTADDGTCVYRTWEGFAGPIARIVKWKYEQTLQARFEDWVRDLKAFVEGQGGGA